MSKGPRPVRQFARALGVILVLLLLLLTMRLWTLTHESAALYQEGQAYADDSLEAITTHWNLSEARARASGRLRRAVSEDHLQSMFTYFASLGSLISHRACTGEAASIAVLNGYTRARADFTCNAVYQQGSATITIQVLKENGRWFVNGFDVTSTVLQKTPPSQRI